MSNFSKLILLSLAAILLCAPVFVSAADPYGLENAMTEAGGSIPKTIGSGKASTVPTVIGEIIGVGLSMIGVVFFLLMLYGGFYWMIARGDSAKVDKAKETMEAAVIGLVIVSGAYAIASFVFSNLVK